MDAEKKNYYEILEVEENANPEQIDNAYLRSKNAYSGESVAIYSLMTKEECDLILCQVEEAYSILGFPEKRREYDKIRGFNQNTGLKTHTHKMSTSEDRPKENVEYENYGSNLIEAKVSKITAQKKFALEYSKNPEFEKRINNCIDFSGIFLKEIRDYKNVSIDRMAEMTRISKTHLIALENEDIKKLPADVYVRGYAYQYAKVLKLNPEQVATSFLSHLKKLKNQK